MITYRFYFRYCHSRPQSPSFFGHVVLKRGAIYKLSRVALRTGMANDQNKPLSMTKLEKPHFRGLKAQ